MGDHDLILPVDSFREVFFNTAVFKRSWCVFLFPYRIQVQVLGNTAKPGAQAAFSIEAVDAFDRSIECLLGQFLCQLSVSADANQESLYCTAVLTVYAIHVCR